MSEEQVETPMTAEARAVFDAIMQGGSGSGAVVRMPASDKLLPEPPTWEEEPPPPPVEHTPDQRRVLSARAYLKARLPELAKVAGVWPDSPLISDPEVVPMRECPAQRIEVRLGHIPGPSGARREAGRRWVRWETKPRADARTKALINSRLTSLTDTEEARVRQEIALELETELTEKLSSPPEWRFTSFGRDESGAYVSCWEDQAGGLTAFGAIAAFTVLVVCDPEELTIRYLDGLLQYRTTPVLCILGLFSDVLPTAETTGPLEQRGITWRSLGEGFEQFHQEREARHAAQKEQARQAALVRGLEI